MTDAEVINNSPLLPSELRDISASVGGLTDAERAVVSKMACEAYGRRQIIREIERQRERGRGTLRA